jgi:hypothetical protein
MFTVWGSRDKIVVARLWAGCRDPVPGGAKDRFLLQNIQIIFRAY